MRAPVLCALVLVCAAAPARRAESGQTQPPPAAPDAQSKSAPAPAPSEPYTYQTEGRRDPFLSLVGAGPDTRPSASARKAEGTAGMTLAEVSVRGVMQGRGTLVAMVQGPDNKTYIVHQGDKFLDGTIKAITAQGLVVLQEVNDPLSLVKQREVRKLLRSLEDSKE